jgi:hypothetical protein
MFEFSCDPAAAAAAAAAAAKNFIAARRAAISFLAGSNLLQTLSSFFHQEFSHAVLCADQCALDFAARHYRFCLYAAFSTLVCGRQDCLYQRALCRQSASFERNAASVREWLRRDASSCVCIFIRHFFNFKMLIPHSGWKTSD